MDRIDICYLSGTNYRRYIAIALSGRRCPDANGFVCIANMQCLAIRLGMHGDGLYTHLLACPDNAIRDLAAVRYQNFADISRTHQKTKPQSHGDTEKQTLDLACCKNTLCLCVSVVKNPLFPNSKQWLTEFHRLAVLRIDLDDLAARLCLDLV